MKLIHIFLNTKFKILNKIRKEYLWTNLINVTLNENKEPVVSARQLHKSLEVKSRTTTSFKINGKRLWNQDEIIKAIELLDLSKDDIVEYFFNY